MAAGILKNFRIFKLKIDAMQSQFVVEICQHKISPDLWGGSISRNVVVHLEGLYRNKVIRSSEHKMQAGTQLALPWSDKLDEVSIVYRYIDDKLKIELGSSSYKIPTEYGFNTDGDNNRTILDIFPNGGTSRIGRVLCNIRVQKLYFDEKDHDHARHRKEASNNFAEALPGFKFHRLAKAINWNKIKLINVDRVIETNDIRTVVSCIDDIALGDAAEEDCDPRVLKALNLAQFTAQYLLSSKKVMDEKKKIIQNALKTFQSEEDILDLKITKLRARKKAMRREMEEMDRISESYMTTLKTLKPRLKVPKSYDHLIASSSSDSDHDIQYPASKSSSSNKHSQQRQHKHKSDKTWQSTKTSLESTQSSSVKEQTHEGYLEDDPLPMKPLVWKSAKDKEKEKEKEKEKTRESFKSTITASTLTKSRNYGEDDSEEEDEEDDGLRYFHPNTTTSSRSIASTKQVSVQEKKQQQIKPEYSRNSTTAEITSSSRHDYSNSLDTKSSLLGLTNTTAGLSSTAGMSIDSLNIPNPSMEPLVETSSSSSVVLEPPQMSLMQQISTSRTWSASSSNRLYVKETSNSIDLQGSAHFVNTFPPQAKNQNNSAVVKESEAKGVIVAISTAPAAVSNQNQLDSRHNESSILTEKLEESESFCGEDDSHLSDSKFKATGGQRQQAEEKSSFPSSSSARQAQSREDKQADAKRDAAEYKASFQQEQQYEDDSGSYGESFEAPMTNNTLRSDNSENYSVNFDLSLDPREHNNNNTLKHTGWNSEGSDSPTKFDYTSMRKNQGDDDMVLLGTGKFPGGGGFDSTTTTTTSHNNFDTLRTTNTDTGNFEPDSLAGSDMQRLEESSAIFATLQGTAMTNASNGGGSYSSGFEEEETAVSDIQMREEESKYNPPMDDTLVWEIGKAPLDLLELASAFEVYVSTVRMSSSVARQISVEFEFLDILSDPAPPITLRMNDIIQPLNFAAYMAFDTTQITTLKKFVSELRESLNIKIYVYNAIDDSLLGTAIVGIWIMIEDGCNIVRQEVDIYSSDVPSNIIGAVLVDVKGHRLLKSCFK